MAPNEQGAADQQEKAQLGTLSAVEAVVNEYAKKFARKYRVSDEQYKVHLVTQFKGIMGLKRGPVAQIILLWPNAQPSINTLLDSAFKTISRSHLIDTLAVEPVIHIRRRAEERRKLLRERIGDEADVILDLIPKSRLIVRQTVTTTIEDSVTGEKVTITHEGKPEHYTNHDISLWLQISRQVRDKYPETEELSDADTQQLAEARRLLDARKDDEHGDGGSGTDDRASA